MFVYNYVVLRTVRIVVRLATSTSTKAALEEAQDGVASWGELCRLLADERPEGRLGGRCCCFLCHGIVLNAMSQPQRKGLRIFAPCSAGETRRLSAKPCALLISFMTARRLCAYPLPAKRSAAPSASDSNTRMHDARMVLASLLITLALDPRCERGAA